MFKITVNIRQSSMKVCTDFCPDEKIGKYLFENSN